MAAQPKAGRKRNRAPRGDDDAVAALLAFNTTAWNVCVSKAARRDRPPDAKADTAQLPDLYSHPGCEAGELALSDTLACSVVGPCASDWCSSAMSISSDEASSNLF